MTRSAWLLVWFASFLLLPQSRLSGVVVSFPSGPLTLHGVLYKPEGAGPFPAIVYNHGSAPGMLSKEAFDALGPVFARHGWVFFGPYRRGQGLSASAGPYIRDEIESAERKGGITAAAAVMIRLLETDHLNDQLAALAWLRKQPFVQSDRVAVGAILSAALRPFWEPRKEATALRSTPRAAPRAGRERRNSTRS
jgi:hypothetical protein